jgi:phenylalanyl-tRNA synthetase beta chain
VRLPLSWLRELVDAPDDVRLVGERLAACGFEVAAIEGEVIDLEVTANRPDCLSISGLAREVATAFGLKVKHPGTPEPRNPGTPEPRNPGTQAPRNPIPVSIEDDGCGRFALAVLDVRVGPSPAWMANRLVAAGVRPINNVVDITNYVMFEIHPMHAFDAAKLAGPELHIRPARPEERLTTLDGQERTLDASVLVVADRDRAVSIAGIMGGANSEVSAGTTRIALEAAWWQPAQVRRTSRRLGLKTEAAARFERGADTEGPVRAIARAVQLFEAIGAGRPVAATLDVYPRPFPVVRVPLLRTHMARLLGDQVPDGDVERILGRLGFGISATPSGWDVEVPAFRVDVRREADLIEEVGRHWGYDRIPATFPELKCPPERPAPAVTRDRTVRRFLTAAGLQEAATFTFIEEAAARSFVEAPGALVAIANPLSEKFAVLRPSLLPGLLDALIYSRRRETADVRLFETGSVFTPRGERHAVGWVMTGARADHWSHPSEPLDFFDGKGVAEVLARALGGAVHARAVDVPWFVRGRAARLIAADGTTEALMGFVGQIRPEIVAARGLGESDAVVGGEIDLDALVAAGAGTARGVAPVPRFPSIVRDLSIVIDERLPAAAVRGTIRSSAPPTLVDVREFDRYQGRGVPPERVSLSMRLTFRAADRTLTDAEVQEAVDAIVAALAGEHGAVLRGTE